MRYFLSQSATAELGNIWNYTAKRWNEEQADRYIGSIRTACEAIAEKRKAGRPIPGMPYGYMKLAVGSHLVIYRFDAIGDVDILRILHQSIRQNAFEGLKAQKGA